LEVTLQNHALIFLLNKKCKEPKAKVIEAKDKGLYYKSVLELKSNSS